MESRSDLVDSELNRESPAPARSLLAPPPGTIGGVRAIFWNERELRAGWRLLIYLVLFLAIGGVESFAARLLHLPVATPTTITASGLLVPEVILLSAALAAAAILGILEGLGFGYYGLPRSIAFGSG